MSDADKLQLVIFVFGGLMFVWLIAIVWLLLTIRRHDKRVARQIEILESENKPQKAQAANLLWKQP